MKTSLAISLLILLQACCPKKELIERDFSRILEREIKDTLIPGFTIRTSFPVTQIDSFPVNVIRTIPAANGSGELRIWRDAYGNLQAECESKDKQISSLVREIERIRESKNSYTITKPNFFDRLGIFLEWLPWAIFSIMAAILIFRAIRR